MKNRVAVLLAVLLAFAGCSNIVTRVDYDETADFSAYKTFGWEPTPATSVEDKSSRAHRHIVDGIQAKLEAGGLQLVESGPDLLVTYHAYVRQDMRSNTQGFDVGYGSGWRSDPNYSSKATEEGAEATALSYGRGFLTIDILDAETNTMVWRGSVEKVMTDNPEQDLADIDKAIDQLAAQWRKKHKR